MFLDQYAACVSTGPLGPIVGAWTEAKWVREFGDSPGSLDRTLRLITSTATSMGTPVPLVIQRVDVHTAWQLPDGRVVAVVTWTPEPPEPEGFFAIDTLVLVRHDGRWLIDDNWYGQGCYFVQPEHCPYGPPDGTPSA